MSATSTSRRVSFGVFDLDLQTGELRKSGVRLRFQDQPFQILRELVLEPGELVTRERLQEILWPEETFVDFDHSLNAAVKKLRDVLGDDARSPRFIETLPKKGYRFIAPVESIDDGATEPQPKRWGKLAAGFGAVTLAALAVFALWPDPDPLPQRFLERPLTSDIGSERLPSLSPDGMRVAYSWFNRPDGSDDSDIYIRLVDEPSGVARPLTREAGNDWWPAWSPDATRIAFIRDHAPEARLPGSGDALELRVAPASGGPSRLLLRFSARMNFYAKPAWSPDGQYIALGGQLDPNKPARTNRILLYSLETSEAQALTEDAGDVGPHHPVFSPRGDELAFRGGFTTAGERGLYLLELDESRRPRTEPRLAVPGIWWSPSWSSGGERLFFLSQGDDPGLWSAAASGNEPAELVWAFRSNYGLAIAKGPSGRLRAVATVESGDTDLMRASLLDPNAPPEPLIQTNQLEEKAEYSPGDGARVAFYSDRSGAPAIWVSDASGGAAQAIAPVSEGAFAWPVWSPDGDQIVFHQRTQDGMQVFVVDSSGGSHARLVADGRRPGWSRDGAWIYFRSSIGAEVKDDAMAVWRIRAEGGVPEKVVNLDTVQQGQTIESANGRTLYASAGRYLFVIALGEDGLATGKPTTLAEDIRAFSVVGDLVYYCTINGEVILYDPLSEKTETLRRLGDDAGLDCSVSPDGRWLLYTREVRTGHDLALLDAAP